MPTILGQSFQPSWGGRPARMSPEDFDIWARWWPKARGDARELYFDVGLGLADELPVSEDADQLIGWIRNTQKRADVLVVRPSSVDVVELRFNANLNAVGRLEGYTVLLGDDNPFRLQIRGVLVTNRADSEVARMALRKGFLFEVV
jgi:hypothetical protein